ARGRRGDRADRPAPDGGAAAAGGRGPHAAAGRPAGGRARERAHPGRRGQPRAGLDGPGCGRADPLRHPAAPARLRAAHSARSTPRGGTRMTRLLAGLAALAALVLTGCDIHVGPVNVVRGSGNVKTESREVHDFDRVDVSGGGTLTITQGSTESLTIS